MTPAGAVGAIKMLEQIAANPNDSFAAEAAAAIKAAKGRVTAGADAQSEKQLKAKDSGGWTSQPGKMQADIKAIYDKKLKDPTWEPANKGKMNQAELAAFNAAAAEAAQRTDLEGVNGQDSLNAKAAYEQGSALKGITEDYSKKVAGMNTGSKKNAAVEGGIEADMGYDTTHRGKRLANNPKATAAAEKQQANIDNDAALAKEGWVLSSVSKRTSTGKRHSVPMWVNRKTGQKQSRKPTLKVNPAIIAGTQAAHPLEGNS
jgi:hypothetical protein